jgi:tRNA(Ile)-lysidine synthase
MFDANSLLSFLSEIKPSQRILIAYSGGLDSHVLLHALANVADSTSHQKLIALHVNHGWSSQAKNWELHCQSECEKLHIHCKIISINANKEKGKSLEALAREARYSAFANEMENGDYLLTAHQQDDQAETLLLQLFRGAGFKGLASMPFITPFAKGFHARPLLPFTREELHLYAKQNQLAWIEDDSNVNTRFDRNYLRHEIMPLIKKRWPSVAHSLSRTAAHCAEGAALLENLAKEDFQKIISTGNSGASRISSRSAGIAALPLSPLLDLNIAKQRHVLRYWFEQHNIPLPNQVQLEHIVKDVLQSKVDSSPRVTWCDVALTRYQDHLYLLSAAIFSKEKKSSIIPWDFNERLTLRDGSFLETRKIKGSGISAALLVEKKLTVRFRKYGERLHPQGRQGSHPLKKLFQEWKIPPWDRGTIPLIYADDVLVAVAGYAIAQGFAAKEDEMGLLFYLVSA